MKFPWQRGKDDEDEVAQAVRRGLESELAALEAATPGLAKRVVRYLCEGAPAEVPRELAATQGADHALDIHGRGSGAKPIYRELELLPAAVGLRFARCIDALGTGRRDSTSLRLPISARSTWLESLLHHSMRWGVNASGGSYRGDSALTVDCIERLLSEDGLPPESLVAGLFLADAKHNYSTDALKQMARITGFAEGVVRHRDAIRPVFALEAHEQRVFALELLAEQGIKAAECFAAEIARCAVDGSKAVRACAQPLLHKVGAGALEPLTRIARDGDPRERSLAFQYLWNLGGEAQAFGARDFVRARRGEETTRSVLEAIDALEAHTAAVAEAAPLEVPGLPAVDAEPPLPEALRPSLDQAIARANRAIAEANHRLAVEAPSASAVELISVAETDRLWNYLGSRGDPPAFLTHAAFYVVRERVIEELRRFLGGAGIAPAHVMRIFHALQRMVDYRRVFDADLARALHAHYRQHKRPSLLELEALAPAFGLNPEIVAQSYVFMPARAGFAAGWDDAHVWPFFARRLDTLREWLKLTSRDSWFHREAVFTAIGSFPEPPAEFVARLFEIALGAARTDRVAAQDALRKLPDRDARVIAALAERKADTRAAAAQWLGRIACTKAVPALQAALRKETNDACIGAMMTALEALGVDVDQLLDRDKLPAEAAKGLVKDVPAMLAWFPWYAMPEVRWKSPSAIESLPQRGPRGEGRGEGKSVPREVLKWFVVQAAKLKSSEPNAVLRRYAAMMVAGDRERFGQFVLAAWIAEDLRPFEGAEAEARALEQARLMSTGQQSNPLLWKPEHRGRPVEELYALYLPPILRQPRGSAADSKGILAIAAACCGREAAPAVARYLKDWYGTRASQGKALIAMLAWIEHPSATQVLLSVGRRFRTKGLQDEATKQVEALAERKGWSVAELADRTVPTAGFDERGVLELSFGSRRFIARLGEGLAIALEDADGRKIAALPEPRQDDDAELAAQAKKALSAAKKDIKAMVKQQDERLYEALCTQRTWRFEDWDHFLNRHPVLRRRVQGLVWAELRDGNAITPFRPLDDGTLSGVDDAPVEVAPDARVGLVHDTHLAAGQVQAWLKHLADYEVAAPFAQLGKGVYALPEASRDDRYVADFNGYVLEAFALRGRATQLGYVRQLAEDGGGWFCRYHKRFASIGLDAVIEFSGNTLPEQNRPVALQSLSFEAISAEPDGTASAVALGEVPPVLLSESHHDLRLIAAEGTGYDPDWIETLKSWKA